MFEDLKPHLKELRKRVSISVLSVLIMFFISFYFWDIILEWMKQPLEDVLPDGAKITFTQVQETFFTALKVSFFAGFVFALPIIFWQLWLFVAPALYKKEKLIIIPFVFFATVMFLVGATFAYYIVIPYGFEFLINFGSQLFTALISIGSYVGFFSKLMFGFGLSFELPVVTFFLAKIGLLTDQTLKDFFKYAVVIIFILSALLTPPDVLTQVLMAGPMICLYIISIYIAKLTNPAPKE
jgi:sec-independent protein translocase protein TatC